MSSLLLMSICALEAVRIQTKNPDSYAGESMFPAHRETKAESGEKLPDIENLLEGEQTMLEIMLKRPGTEPLAKDFYCYHRPLSLLPHVLAPVQSYTVIGQCDEARQEGKGRGVIC